MWPCPGKTRSSISDPCRRGGSSNASSVTRVERIVVVGADAAGMSAAHQALRTAEVTGRSIEVIALEQTSDTSYSACGIPYLVGGLVERVRAL